MRILLADDHGVVRQGLRLILADAFKRAVFGEAANSQQTLDRAAKEPWDIVILDLTMPGRSGLDVLKEIKRRCPTLPVLILSMHPEDQFAVRLLKAGAAGYLTKESVVEELVGAIKKAVAGGRYISPGLAEKMASLLVNEIHEAPHERLSDREFLILGLIASGKPVGVIARELALSVKTVSTYRTRLLEKMGLTNNAEIVHYAFHHHLVPRPPQAPGTTASFKAAPEPGPVSTPLPTPTKPGPHPRLVRRPASSIAKRPPRRRPF